MAWSRRTDGELYKIDVDPTGYPCPRCGQQTHKQACDFDMLNNMMIADNYKQQIRRVELMYREFLGDEIADKLGYSK